MLIGQNVDETWKRNYLVEMQPIGHFVVTECVSVQALQQRSAAEQAAGDTKATSQLTSVQAELERTTGQLKAVTAEVDQLKQQNEASL